MSLAQSPAHQAMLAKAQRYFPGGSNGNVTMPPEYAFVIAAGQGSRVSDLEGHSWIDYLLGSGPMILGHAHPQVVAAVQEQLGQGSTFFYLHEKTIELAEAVVEAMPCAEQVRFTSSGTEATFFALRVARAFRGRDKILKFEGAYHGSHDYAMMNTEGQTPQEYPQAVRGSAGIPHSLENEVLVAPYNDLERTTAIIEQHHNALAAVIVEPFQRTLSPVPGFLQGLRQVTAHYGIPLIYDEVVTGFRFAYGGAQEYYGVVPDIAAVGKIIGGGYPLAAVVGTAEIMSCFAEPNDEGLTIGQVGTLNGNPIAATAGLATLRVLRQPGAYERLRAVGQRLRDLLAAILREHHVAGQVLGDGPLYHVVFTDRPVQTYRDMLTANAQQHRVFHNELLNHGVLKPASKGYISLAHSDADIEETAKAFDAAMAKVATAS
jgi:glutamate-1-semialdehyde 2,1-aminomutase